MTVSKDLQPLIRKARKQGWTVEWTKNNHLRWTNPDGERTGSGATLSDRRAVKNITKRLERLGLAV